MFGSSDDGIGSKYGSSVRIRIKSNSRVRDRGSKDLTIGTEEKKN